MSMVPRRMCASKARRCIDRASPGKKYTLIFSGKRSLYGGRNEKTVRYVVHRYRTHMHPNIQKETLDLATTHTCKLMPPVEVSRRTVLSGASSWRGSQ
jgi:hypothetical protein